LSTPWLHEPKLKKQEGRFSYLPTILLGHENDYDDDSYPENS